MDDKFVTFPSNSMEALALIYAEKTFDPALTPEQFFQTYRDAYNRIREESRKSKEGHKWSY